MKVDGEHSRYQTDEAACKEFDRGEIRKAKYLLRRLWFLETSIAQKGGMLSSGGNGGGVHAEMELEALEWALGPNGVGFITINEDRL